MVPSIGSAEWEHWWSVPIERRHPRPGVPQTVAEWAWGLCRFGFEVQLRVCLGIAVELLPTWRSYRPLVYEDDLANDPTPAWAISLAERRLAGERFPPGGEADRCAEAATRLRDTTWANADECAQNNDSPVSMDEMARQSDVYAALARAAAWTEEGARACALEGEEDEAVAAGPADCCVAAVTAWMTLRALDLDGVRAVLLSRLVAAPPVAR